MVPVKRLWIALKPVSKGDPCAIAATGAIKSRATSTAVAGPHVDRRRLHRKRQSASRSRRSHSMYRPVPPKPSLACLLLPSTKSKPMASECFIGLPAIQGTRNSLAAWIPGLIVHVPRADSTPGQSLPSHRAGSPWLWIYGGSGRTKTVWRVWEDSAGFRANSDTA
jgi:hypothetical protein